MNLFKKKLFFDISIEIIVIAYRFAIRSFNKFNLRIALCMRKNEKPTQSATETKQKRNKINCKICLES